MFDLVVVGAGLIGSAAAKYTANGGLETMLIGPSEPKTPSQSIVFSSHYDQGRIVRSIDRDETWSRWAIASMRRFESIELESGISFHALSGFLRVGLSLGETNPLSDVGSLSALLGVDTAMLDGEALAGAFPYFAFPAGAVGILERGLSGHINPRALVQAQLRLFQRAGGRLVRDVVQRIERTQDHFRVIGNVAAYESRRVLVCAGAWSHLLDLTPEPLDVSVKAETVVLIPVTVTEAAELASMPSLWYSFSWHPVLPHVYLVPPVRYPDGSSYIKVGADNDRDVRIDTAEDAAAYFRSDGSAETRRNLLEVIAEFLPEFSGRAVVTRPCILTYSRSRHPVMEELADGWFVASAGNGAAAKSSDEIGRLAAQMLLS